MELNRRIIGLAATLAHMRKGRLLVVHAFGGHGELMLDFQQIEHQEYMLDGPPEDVLPNFAKEHKVVILVMGTVERVDAPGLFIGNTAKQVLHRIKCSVLTVKPEGFVSPVRLEEHTGPEQNRKVSCCL